MTFDVPRTSAIAALLIVLAGFGFIVRPIEAAIGERYADVDAGRAALERSIGLARRIPALQRERAGLRIQLVRLHLTDRRAMLLERFLHTIGSIAQSDAIAIVRVAAVPPAFATVPHSAPAPLVEELPLELTVRGRYGDLLRAARDLGTGSVAARVTFGSLGGTERKPGARPLLSATLHVLLLRAAG